MDEIATFKLCTAVRAQCLLFWSRSLLPELCRC